MNLSELTKKEMNFVLVGLERLRAYYSSRSDDDDTPISESLRLEGYVGEIDVLYRKLESVGEPNPVFPESGSVLL